MINIGSQYGIHAGLKAFALGFEIVINIGVNAKTDSGFRRKIKDHGIRPVQVDGCRIGVFSNGFGNVFIGERVESGPVSIRCFKFVQVFN